MKKSFSLGIAAIVIVGIFFGFISNVSAVQYPLRWDWHNSGEGQWILDTGTSGDPIQDAASIGCYGFVPDPLQQYTCAYHNVFVEDLTPGEYQVRTEAYYATNCDEVILVESSDGNSVTIPDQDNIPPDDCRPDGPNIRISSPLFNLDMCDEGGYIKFRHNVQNPAGGPSLQLALVEAVRIGDGGCSFPPEADLSINDGDSASIAYNNSVTLEWCGADAHACANATQCTVGTSFDGSEIEAQNTSGTATLTNIIADQTYYLRCDSLSGITRDTAEVTVGAIQDPVAINLQQATQNYCSAPSPPVVVSWVFSPLEAGTQDAFQVQVDDNSDFSSIEKDSGKVPGASEQYAPIALSYNTTYYWRVKVWNVEDTASAWIVGPSFTTALHAYPDPQNFNWSPNPFRVDLPTQFEDGDGFAPGSSNHSWNWDFGDGNFSTEEDPIYTYEDDGPHDISLQVCDDIGCCSALRNNVTAGEGVWFPNWKEISPF